MLIFLDATTPEKTTLINFIVKLLNIPSVNLILGGIIGLCSTIFIDSKNNKKEIEKEKRIAFVELKSIVSHISNLVATSFDHQIHQIYHWTGFKYGFFDGEKSYKQANCYLEKYTSTVNKILEIEPKFTKQIYYIGALYNKNVDKINEYADIDNINDHEYTQYLDNLKNSNTAEELNDLFMSEEYNYIVTNYKKLCYNYFNHIFILLENIGIKI